MKIVRPRKKALAEAREELEIKQKELHIAKTNLEEVIRKLTDLQEKLKEAERITKELQDDLDLCESRLERATQLTEGLKHEKVDWDKFVIKWSSALDTIEGDILLCSGYISYLGAFTPEYRYSTIQAWQKQLESFAITTTQEFDMTAILGDPHRIKEWQLNDLAVDAFSTDNGVVMDNSSRYALCVDPQMQANRWLKKT